MYPLEPSALQAPGTSLQKHRLGPRPIQLDSNLRAILKYKHFSVSVKLRHLLLNRLDLLAHSELLGCANHDHQEQDTTQQVI